jgi:dsRNA-specific ribonuclease
MKIYIYIYKITDEMSIKKKGGCSKLCGEHQYLLGKRDDSFKDMLTSTLKRSKFTDEYINVLTSKKSLHLYEQAFTHKTVSDKNYEVFEQKGDAIAGSFLVNYAYETFPQLNCDKGVQIVALFKIKYGSKNTFAYLAENLNFWDYISACSETKYVNRKDLLEDCFEAFIGVTNEICLMQHKKFGLAIGYLLCYNILQSVFNEFIDVSLVYENLKSPITILKEVFDNVKPSPIKYENLEYNKETQTLGVVITYTGIIYGKYNTYKIAEAHELKRDDSKEKAARNALVYLKQLGIYRGPPEDWLLF